MLVFKVTRVGAEIKKVQLRFAAADLLQFLFRELRELVFQGSDFLLEGVEFFNSFYAVFSFQSLLCILLRITGKNAKKRGKVYLFSDLTVLLLSLTYIPLEKILCSLLTVVLSGQIIDLVTGLRFSLLLPFHKKAGNR